MSENDILPCMIKDHCKIENLLDDFQENIEKEYSLMKKSFTKFEWELEKHIFVEEKAIFTSYHPEDVSEGYKMLPELTIQHNFILNQLNNWRRDFQSKKKIDGLNKFKKFLIKHKEFEEKEIYPKLDQSMDEKQKKYIIDRLDEII